VPAPDPKGDPLIQVDEMATEQEMSMTSTVSNVPDVTLLKNDIEKLLDAMHRLLSPKNRDYLRLHHRLILKHMSQVQI
jgi:hypothetical protein